MEIRKKFNVPGKHPGCQKCANLGTPNCRCKANTSPVCQVQNGAAPAAAPASNVEDLVAEITKKVIAGLK